MNVLEEKLSVSKQIVEVPPSDYLSLKKKIQSDSELIYQLEQRCHTLEHILAYCEISPMSQIIKEYKSMSNFYLTQLVTEIEIYRFNSEERSKLLEFVDYLYSVTNEIEDLLLIKK